MAQALSSTWVEALVCVFINSAVVHRDDDPKQPEIPTNRLHPSSNRYNPFSHYSSSSSSLFSQVSSLVTAHLQVLPCA
jgi:hypothetical protein